MKYRNELKAIAVLGTLALLAVLLCSASSAYLDSFWADPPPTSTIAPSPKQVQFCRDAMYIQPNLKITPIGFYYAEHWLDDEMAFKFTANTNDLSLIFRSEFVPVDELSPNYEIGILNEEQEVQWWQPEGHDLIGGGFTVPSPNSTGDRAISVGISKNSDDTFTVYATWNEF